MDYLITFASAEATEAKQDLFSSIGIDWKLLILQTIAFLILLWFLKKFVYPSLVAMLDKREKMSNQAATTLAQVDLPTEVPGLAETKKAVQIKQAESPAFVREGRPPTKEELMEMTPEEINRAFYKQ